MTNASVTENEDDERDEEVGDGEPRDVRLDAPTFGESSEARVGIVAVKDDGLRDAKYDGNDPSHADHNVGPSGGPGAIGQRVTNGLKLRV